MYLDVSTKMQLALLWKYILLHKYIPNLNMALLLVQSTGTSASPAHAWTSSNDGHPHLPRLICKGRSETWRKHSLQQFILQSLLILKLDLYICTCIASSQIEFPAFQCHTQVPFLCDRINIPPLNSLIIKSHQKTK